MKALPLLVFVNALMPGADFKLPAGCTLPFAAIAPKTDAMGSCGNNGSGLNGTAAPLAKVLEDNAKNNFCADPSKPVTVDFVILRNMQAKSPDKKPLEDATHPSRASLKNFFPVGSQKIGEGTVVRLKAMIKDAHVSDCSTGSIGEEVNCKLLGVEHNDFHIPLLDPSKPSPAAQDECTSVTAEMSPHFRPDAWNLIDLKTPTANPVRVTGPLFFDDSHEVCEMSGGTVTRSVNPKRSSLWEIHPVYGLDVCSSNDPSKCDVNSSSAAMWTPYDQWVGSHAADTTASGKGQREACVSAAKQASGSTGAK
jgi:hypothetical protein